MIHIDENNRISGKVEMQTLATTRPTADTPSRYDEVLQATVEAYLKTGSGTTQASLAKQVGVTPAVISAWLSSSYKGDVARIERMVADVLKAASNRVSDTHSLFETPPTMEVNAACENTKRRNRIALVSGAAGVGKTSGIILYKRSNPTCVVVTAMKGEANELAIARGLFREIDTRKFSTKKGDTRLSFLTEHFRQSNRLIIIDNAHRLTRGGLQFVFDFHDDTGCPVCLVGNPEVLQKIRENDQMFSRISVHIQITFSEPTRTATKLLSDMCPQHGTELLPLALQVITKFGHVRSLRYQIEETLDMFNDGKGPFKSITQAFKAAHTQLIRDYDLKT